MVKAVQKDPSKLSDMINNDQAQFPRHR
jgi:hypothetical protein